MWVAADLGDASHGRREGSAKTQAIFKLSPVRQQRAPQPVMLRDPCPLRPQASRTKNKSFDSAGHRLRDRHAHHLFHSCATLRAPAHGVVPRARRSRNATRDMIRAMASYIHLWYAPTITRERARALHRVPSCTPTRLAAQTCPPLI